MAVPEANELKIYYRQTLNATKSLKKGAFRIITLQN
jgi:hypothetical protein